MIVSSEIAHQDISILKESKLFLLFQLLKHLHFFYKLQKITDRLRIVQNIELTIFLRKATSSALTDYIWFLERY